MNADELDIATTLNGFNDKYAKDRLHTMCPGKVVTYDPKNRTADVQPQVRQRDNGVITTYPVLKDVKVQFPGGAEWGVSWEPQAGDTGALMFSERSIAEWITQGGVVTPKSDRHHHLSDAFFIPGVWPDGSEPHTHTGDGITVANKDNSINLTLTSGGVAVKGDLDVDGGISASGDVTASGIGGTVSLFGHSHPGSGAPPTPIPVP